MAKPSGPSIHVPVLLNEVISFVNTGAGKTFIDGTAGDGGYIEEILKINPQARILGIDWDEQAIARLSAKFASNNNVVLAQGNYSDLTQPAAQHNFGKVSGVILDLGFSSLQIEDSDRGFSFQLEGPLDMRYSKNNPLTAQIIINKYPKEKLEKIFIEYGEEKFYKRIASQIVVQRALDPIHSTSQLVHAIVEALPKSVRFKQNDSLRRIFQALRIEVNGELDNLRKVLPQIVDILEPGGRVVIISFHSLEDRIVKEFFKKAASGCVCPPEFPTCICNKQISLKILTKKPVTASEVELLNNPRSKPAKLRAAEKVM